MDTTADFDDIVATVTAMVVEQVGEDAAKAGPDADLTAMDGVDSVKVLRVVAAIERRYDIELEDEDVFGVKTIRDVAKCVSVAVRDKVGAR